MSLLSDLDAGFAEAFSVGKTLTAWEAMKAGARLALQAAEEAVAANDSCVICGSALLEQYPPHCEDTCRDQWHDYLDEHGDEHPSATSRIRALRAELETR